MFVLIKLSGNQLAYPVYLTIKNMSKNIRRKASMNAATIVGYLPIDHFKDVPIKPLQTRLKGELIYSAMRSVMEPLPGAGKTGVEMWCADGYLRRVYLLLALFVGDWPEQNTMACMVRSGCPVCLKKSAGREDERRGVVRTCISMLQALSRYQKTGNLTALTWLHQKNVASL
jgi:hypothetical protein